MFGHGANKTNIQQYNRLIINKLTKQKQLNYDDFFNNKKQIKYLTYMKVNQIEFPWCFCLYSDGVVPNFCLKQRLK